MIKQVTNKHEREKRRRRIAFFLHDEIKLKVTFKTDETLVLVMFIFVLIC